MKKFLLIALLTMVSISNYAQNCIDILSAHFSNPSGDDTTWRLTINYAANGTKNLKTYVFVNSDTVFTACFQSSGNISSGTIIYDNIIATGGLATLVAKFSRRTGTCDNGTACQADDILIGNVLDLKITDLFARNVGNFTEITFKILSISPEDKIVFNFQLPDGEIKNHEIKLNDAAAGQTWKILYDNITNNYSALKIK